MLVFEAFNSTIVKDVEWTLVEPFPSTILDFSCYAPILGVYNQGFVTNTFRYAV